MNIAQQIVDSLPKERIDNAPKKRQTVIIENESILFNYLPTKFIENIIEEEYEKTRGLIKFDDKSVLVYGNLSNAKTYVLWSEA